MSGAAFFRRPGFIATAFFTTSGVAAYHFSSPGSIRLRADAPPRPTSSSNAVPKSQRFKSSDFPRIAPGVDHLPTTVVPRGIDCLLDRHRVEQDDEFHNAYSSLPPSLKESALPFLAEQAGEELPSHKGFSSVAINDGRFYIAHTGSNKGYGLYAERDILPGEVIGIYTGYLNDKHSSDYRWNYQSSSKLKVPGPDSALESSVGLNTKSGDTVEFGVDAERGGNVLRFINHDDRPSIDVHYMPYGNRWHVVYITNRRIKKDEELTVSYGWPFIEEPVPFDG